MPQILKFFIKNQTLVKVKIVCEQSKFDPLLITTNFIFVKSKKFTEDILISSNFF